MQTRSFLSPKIDVGKLEPTWIGPDAIRDPTIPPPKTRPSGLARETLNIPVLPFAPLVSSNVNDPHRERISKRPCSILYQWLGDQDLPSEQQNIHKKQRSVHGFWNWGQTSYLKIPPERPGWRITTLETTPVAERMQIAREPLSANEEILLTISWL